MNPAEDTILVVFSHHNTPGEPARMGCGVKKTVLPRWLDYHVEDRVLIHENTTVAFA